MSLKSLRFKTFHIMFKPKFFGLFCFLCFHPSLFSQQTNTSSPTQGQQVVVSNNSKLLFTPTDTIAVQDSTQLRPKGGLLLSLPKSLRSSYEYNPVLDVYERLGDFAAYDTDLPLVLSPKSYWDLVKKESIQQYFRDKAAAIAASETSNGLDVKNLLPSFSFQNDILSTIFGGDEITFDAQGSVGVDMGILWQKNDNPALSPRNRSNLSFDFEQQISLSLLGKIGERLSVNASYDTQATFDFQNLIKIAYTPPTIKEVTGVDPTELLDQAKNELGSTRLGGLAQDINNTGLLEDPSQANILNAAKDQFFNPNADNILRNIEVGNVNMPLNTSLITGAQSLFGVKTQLQFGKTQITAVISEQRSQNSSVTAQGGGTLTNFSLTALDYEEDRHFFLSHFFRDQYDQALASYPFINSQVQITRIEVWVTNRLQQTQNIRNVVALQDLGESMLQNTRLGRQGVSQQAFITQPTSNGLPFNSANALDPEQMGKGGFLNDNIREIATVEAGFNLPGLKANQGFDYAILENARKLEEDRDFTYHPSLGYISLSQQLSSDEVLGVAFQYTYMGKVYQVGEFANGGVAASSVVNTTTAPVINNNTLILKLLKSNITQVKDPIWDLMMKNIYPIGAYALSEEDFKFNIIYSDPSPRNYISPVSGAAGWPSDPKPLEQRILLDVFNLDRLNAYQDLQEGGDGFFDFLPGKTVLTESGSIIFTTVEPFGSHLFEVLGGGNYEAVTEEDFNGNQKKYVFRSLYKNTKAAALQQPEKNKFILKGQYKSEGFNGIPIGAINVPRGSVRVTAGGRLLQEGLDYTVNYTAGTVQLLDPSLQASNVPIEISVEDNAVFGQQNRRFSGVNVQHRFSEDFVLGGSLLNLNERPLTQKSNYGTEAVNNTIFGFNANYSTELPFLTRWANELPHVETTVPSMLSVRAEMAFLKPGAPRNADFRGEVTTYLDDFEGAQSLIDVRSALGWSLASTPLEFTSNGQSLYGTSPEDPENLRNGYGRSKLAWYTIDPIFYTIQRPAGVNNNDISTNPTRRIFIDEVFPQTDIAQGQTTVNPTLDLALYPAQKGPYNNAQNFQGLQESEKWAGIMRPLSTTNFEQANIEFVQFWVMDPYVEGVGTDAGELVINLGNISEDILKDGRKQYENGLPGTNSESLVAATSWGQVPATQSLVYAFDVNENNRNLQDIGLDGLSDTQEASIFTNNNSEDPAGDNFRYYLDRTGSILERYLDFNNTQGNAPVAVTNTKRGSTTLPDVEDIDRDLTMNTVNSYYEYRIQIKPNTSIDDPYVTDIKEGTSPRLPNGQELPVRWIQYKIPLSDFTNAVGGISDFRSMSFMRMYLTKFSEPVVLRFASLDLVRGDWRVYQGPLQTDPLQKPADIGTQLEVNTVNVEENSTRIPIPYTLPPGVLREQLNNNNTIIRQNEQSLSLLLRQLAPQDARGVFKNTQFDLRQYKRLRLFMHAEQIVETDYVNTEMPLVGFLRMGTDFSENFYQIELPLEFTPHGASTSESVWPSNNELDIPVAVLAEIKSLGIANQSLSELTYYDYVNGSLIPVNALAPRAAAVMRIGIKGNPSLGNLRGMMVGVKNVSSRPARAEVWFNELRLSGLDNQGGWAALAGMDANMADLISVSANAAKSTSGFGGLDQMPNERSRTDALSYDLVTQINLGKLLPSDWGVQLPLNYGVSEAKSRPEFDPVYEDLKLSDRIGASASGQEAQLIERQAETYTKRSSISLLGVRKNASSEKESPKRFYSPENFTLNYAYNHTQHRDFEIAEMQEQQVRTGFVYGYNFKPLEIAPLAKKDSILKSGYWKWLKDFNLNLLPSNFAVNANINRSFNQQQFRDVASPGEDRLELPFLQQRNYLFNWQYVINYNLTKSLKANLTAASNNIVRNYFNDGREDANNINESLSIWDGFFDYGESNRFVQQLQLNYELPFAKIPFLNFINAQYSYTADFEWQRGGEALRELAEEEMNSVQNANTHTFNASLSMQRFYSFLGLYKNKKNKPAGANVPFSPVLSSQFQKNDKSSIGLDLITMFKRIGFNYAENNGKYLPGFTQRIGFLGTNRPSMGFVFGNQSEVRFNAARRGWLTTFQDFNEPFVMTHNSQFKFTATVQPIADLTIDLFADKQFTENYRETFKIKTTAPFQYEYENLLGNAQGNFSMSAMMIKTFFSSGDADFSENFENFKNYRATIARRLGAGNPEFNGELDAQGFPRAYGKTSQQVLLPAFYAAYTGQSAEKVGLSAFGKLPIPNWNMKYTGFMRLPWFKEKFTRFTVSHGYRAAFSVNSFGTNLEKENSRYHPETGDERPDYIFNNLVLNDAFNPLVRIDFETKSALSMLFEMNMERALSMSFDNNLLTEMQGKEYTLGVGYRIKDVSFTTNIGGSRKRLKSDLNIKADLSLRDNFTLIRNLELDNTQLSAGQYFLSAKLRAEYALSQNLNALFFYDFSFSKYAVSTAFPQQLINTGLSLRYNFGN